MKARLTQSEIDTAYHEAGHVAASLYARRVPFGVTIIPHAKAMGAMFVLWPPDWNRGELRTWQLYRQGGADLRQEAIGLLAGAAVDLRRKREMAGWQQDIAHARLALQALYGDERRAADELPRVFSEAQAFVDCPRVWHAIERIAGELQRRRELKGRKMLNLVLEVAPALHGQVRADESMRGWNGYAALAKSAGGDPLRRLTAEDLPRLFLWPACAAAAALLFHLL